MAVITISRQCGAGGKTLCKMIADKFGYTLADSEIIKMVAEMGDDGDVVILGRGSQYILNDHPDAYHVLLIDEFDNRVRFMKDHYDLSESRAVSAVKGEDKHRKNLYQKLGKTDYDNPFLYHLVLNMSKVSLEQTLELVCKLVDPGKY